MSKSQNLVIDGEGKFLLIPIESIQLAERPDEGDESKRLFFNPRSMDSFDTEAMTRLRESIRLDGLQQPPIVRVFTKDGQKNGEITRIELIAGERRFRSMTLLYEENVKCFDEDSKKMVPGKELYSKIPCKVLYNITDEQALRIAFKENNEHKSLTIKEEVALVERLSEMGYKQDKISDLLQTNVTWISQTANFRKELPKGAFDKLINGQLSRHVAVQILSFSPEHREKLYAEAVAAEAEERKKALEEIQDIVYLAEDEEETALSDQDEAASYGDVAGAKKAKKRANLARKKLDKAKEKELNVIKSEGVIKQGHIIEGGRKADLSPKKSKMLNRPSTEEFYVELINSWIEKGKVDAIYGHTYPTEILKIVKATALGIINGNPDPGVVIRNYLIEEGIWAESDEEQEQEEEEELV